MKAWLSSWFLGLSLLAGAEPATWVPLFNGEDLEGWHTLPGGSWEVVDGVILGTSEKAEKRHGLLMSDRRYRDFILRGRFKVTRGDSGLYFRAEKADTNAAVQGFQAEVDNSPEVGGLYETGRRNWVEKPEPELVARVVEPGEWTDILVTAIGDDITVSLNGVVVTELLDDGECLKEGHVALQLHGNMDMRVEFKDLEILELR